MKKFRHILSIVLMTACMITAVPAVQVHAVETTKAPAVKLEAYKISSDKKVNDMRVNHTLDKIPAVLDSAHISGEDSGCIQFTAPAKGSYWITAGCLKKDPQINIAILNDRGKNITYMDWQKKHGFFTITRDKGQEDLKQDIYYNAHSHLLKLNEGQTIFIKSSGNGSYRYKLTVRSAN